MQIQGSGGGVGSPGDRVRGRDVRLAGTAAGIAQNLRLLVLDAFVGHFLEILLDILVRHENGGRVLRRGRRRRGRITTVAVVAIAPVIAVIAPLLARGLAGDRDNDFLGGLVAGEQQRQGDKEEGDQSFHGGILFRLPQM